MSSDRTTLIVVGNAAFVAEQFSHLLAKLTEKYAVTYLPDTGSCLIYVKQQQQSNSSDSTSIASDSQLFLFSDFDNSTALQSLSHLLPNSRFLGYPAFVDITLSQRRWLKPRPVFNFSMADAVVCITGYRDKGLVNKLATMINWMSGSVQRYLNVNTTTHLVAYRCAGEKVQTAARAVRRIATVRASWIRAAWDRRTERPMLKATESDFVSMHRAKVFQETCLAFVGFTPGSDELAELCNVVVEHDGQVTTDLNDTRLTHVIVTDAWPGYGNIIQDLKCLLVIDSHAQAKSPGDHSTPAALSTGPMSDSLSVVTTADESHYRISLLGSSYRVPVLRLDWFWLSVQLTCLCQLEPFLYVAGPTRTNINVQIPQLPPLARPGERLVDGGCNLSPIVNVHPNIDEPIKEEEEEDTEDHLIDKVIPSSPREVQSLCNLHTPNKQEGADKENHCPNVEFHSFDSPRATTPNPTGHSRDKFKFFSKNQTNSAEKVSFITSPRHRNSPRGFASPSMDVSGGSSSYARRACRTSCSSSHDDLLTQLADPLSFPSNQERRLCQLGQQASTPDWNRYNSYISPTSFSSGALLNATNTSDVNQQLNSTPSAAITCADQKNQGFSSLISSLRDIISADDEVPSADRTGSTALTVRSSAMRYSITGEDLTQTSTPGSSKRKSTQRLSLLHSTARKSRTPASELSANFSEHSKPSDSPSGTPIQVRLEKRQHRVFEFFVTERNYLEILHYLYRVAYPQVIDEEQSGGPLLPRQEADYIFGKLGPIFELHDRLRPKLNELETNWSNYDSSLGDVLNSTLLDDMDKAYEKYMQFYSPPHIHHLGEQYPRFLAFMRQIERRKESGRQNLTALLVRPVQRLPSIALLMEGISKFTPTSHPDHTAITHFTKSLNDLLTNINDRLRKNEERLSLLSLYHEISGAPPEMLSSSRSLVARLNVFELGTSSSGNTTCEPVTLFLLSDSLEVARPRKRHTGEPLAHAIHAALAAIHGETDAVDPTSGGDHNQPNTTTGAERFTGSTVTVSRTGSGASGTSMMNMGLMEGKQRCNYKHLHLLKLNEIKRVVNFDTASPDRAAFGLVVRSNLEMDDRVYAYCLAASFTASAAVAAGRCPEPVESAVVAAQHQQTNTDNRSVDDLNSIHVSALQACVSEAKRSFLNRLCHHIIQVSCLANSPDELLADVLPEELLGFDLEQVFNAMAHKSKKFSRQLARNISIKTPRRPVAGALKSHRSVAPPQTPQSNSNNHDSIPVSSPRRSVLGNLIGHRGAYNTDMSLLTDPTAITSPMDQAGASTPLQNKRKCASLHPPQTPTADLVATAMMNLFRTPHPKTDIYPSSTTCSLYEDYMDDYPNADTSSIASSIYDTGFWPSCGSVIGQQHMKRSTTETLQSSTSIRSSHFDIDFNNTMTECGQKGRHSVSSRRDPAHFGRNSVLHSDRIMRGGERKSVCHSVLAGLKNFRRSIAGAGSALMHGGVSGTNSFSSSTLGRSNHGPSGVSPMLNSPMNRSTSVDAGISAATHSSLTASNDHRSMTLRNTAVPTASPGSPFMPNRSKRWPACSSVPPITKHTTQPALATEENRVFPRSLTTNNVGNFGQPMKNLNQYGRTLTALDVNMDDADENRLQPVHEPDLCGFAERMGGSMVSLLGWDSRSMMNIPEAEMTEDGQIFTVPPSSTGSFCEKQSASNSPGMMWDTVSHLGVSMGDDVRRSFRLPGMKKSTKHRFGYLFQKSSAGQSNRSDKHVTESHLVGAPNRKPNTSRRESLLRGLFSR